MMSLWSCAIPHGLINHGKPLCVCEQREIESWYLLLLYQCVCVTKKKKYVYVSLCD